VKKIIFAGTPEIAAGVLDVLLAANYPIIACLTQPDRPQGRGLKLTPSAVKLRAMQANIPVMQPQTLKSSEIQQQLAALQPDLMIVMAYGLLLPPAVLDIPRLGCINIHASILPRWRGAAPIQYSILSGDVESGISIMQMDAGMDTGDVLATYPCPIYASDTSQDLHERLAKLAQDSCLDVLVKLQASNLQATKQQEALATYAHKIGKQQAKINWSDDVITIDRCIRAYNPWPVAFTNFEDQIVRIWRAEPAASSNLQSNTKPGTIVAVDKQGLLVATGDNGVLKVLAMQFPGKKMLPVADICHAHPQLQSGAVFS